MFLLAKPDHTAIRRFLDACTDDDLSYPEIGATKTGTPPAGYNADHNRLYLGNGIGDYRLAVQAIRDWRIFKMAWLELCWPDTPIETGKNVAILVNHIGFWSLNAARIVYVVEETGDVEIFGFAYGTLNEHVESGEERFTVEFHKESGEVWYDLFAFSKPSHILARLGYPLSRYLQKRFAAGSKEAMLRAVRSISS